MERQHPTRILKVLSQSAPTIGQLEQALACSQLPAVFPKRQVTVVGQAMKPKAYEIAELTLKSLLSRYTKVFLLYPCDQLLTLLCACLCSRYSVQICDIALQYCHQLIETLPLLAFRRAGEQVRIDLYDVLLFFSGTLALLVPQVLQNGLLPRLLKVLHGLNQKGMELNGTKLIGELLLVQAISIRLQEQSKKSFCSFLKSIVRDEAKQSFYNLVLNSQVDRTLDFRKLVVFRVVDDILEKVDLNINTRSHEMFLMPSAARCWPDWVEQGYQGKNTAAQVEALMDSHKVQEVYECFQLLQLWASSPHIDDPSLHMNAQVTDLFINYLEGKPFSGCSYEFRMEKWKEKCVQIQEMLVGIRQREKQALKDIFSGVL